jgi:predicted transcriptional regulator
MHQMIDTHRHILVLAAQIVIAHIRHNDVAIEAVPNLIRSVYGTLQDIGRGLSRASLRAMQTSVNQLEQGHDHDHGHDHEHSAHPAAPNGYEHPLYGQTVFDDRLVCMEDGLSMKMLKRHLLTVHGMTPEEYREKWGLPEEYPMVALTYARLRSSLALQSGLGLKPDARTGKVRRLR